jgi:predicted RNase H-like nuclease (RuvC/YqgF family)
MEKWREWLIIFLSGVVPGFALWLVQRRVTRNKDKIDFINSVLEARLKINELTSKKIDELERETDKLKQDIIHIVRRSTVSLDDCMKHALTIQELNIRLNKTLMEVTDELEIYKEELSRIKNILDEIQGEATEPET